MNRVENIRELLTAAEESQERGEHLRDFLDHAALVSDQDSYDEQAPITLMTLHTAKGLEFPVVFIMGLEDGLFPHSRSIGDANQLEEERRLFYVGMTRAEEKLLSEFGTLPTLFRQCRTTGFGAFAISYGDSAGTRRGCD